MQLRFASVPSVLCGSVAARTAWCFWRSRRKRGQRTGLSGNVANWLARLRRRDGAPLSAVLFPIYIFNISLAIGRQLITIEIGSRAAAVATSLTRVTAPPRCSGFDAHNKVHCHTYLLTATAMAMAVWVNGFRTFAVPSRAPRVGVTPYFPLNSVSTIRTRHRRNSIRFGARMQPRLFAQISH